MQEHIWQLYEAVSCFLVYSSLLVSAKPVFTEATQTPLISNRHPEPEPWRLCLPSRAAPRSPPKRSL